jgi:hypothetical protein
VKREKIVNAIFAIVSLIGALVAGYGPQARTRAVQATAALADTTAPRWADQAQELGIPHIEYALVDGYVHNWLVAGPLSRPVEGDDARAEAVSQHHQAAPDIVDLPVESATLMFQGQEVSWRYYRALDDHYLDLSDRYPAGQTLQAWAYAQIDVVAGGPVTLILTTDGPADVWLNGQHIHRQEHSSASGPRSVSFPGALERGPNDVLLRLEQVGAERTPYAMALRMVTPAAPLAARVLLPTAAEDLARRQWLEALLDEAHLEKSVFLKGNEIVMHWEATLPGGGRYRYRILDSRGRTYLEGAPEVKPSEAVNVGHPVRFWERDYVLALGATPQEYYEHSLRYQRSFPVYIVDNDHAATPYGAYGERRREALEDAARREDDLYAEVAKLALGRWAEVDVEGIVEALAELDANAQGGDRTMVGLLGLLHRYADDPAFPAELAHALDAAIPDSAYWAVDGDGILRAAARILAGQRYGDGDFARRASRGLRRRGERAARAWLRDRADGAFGAWASSDDLEAYVVALSHLAELSGDEEVRALSATALDGLLLSLARNSYRGVLASARGVDAGPSLISGRLQATSGIGRLLWGMGTFNRYTAGTVSLACSTYALPEAVRAAATELSAETWHQERFVIDAGGGPFWRQARMTVERVTYRTPDYMLSSAQGYRVGERGDGEHVWQATLGPDAIVFTTHPANANEDGARVPGFWAGNGVLPRVEQREGVLVATYRLTDDDWMGYTHAHWPVHAFDEQTIRDGRAFARVGSGYVALSAARGLELVTHGPDAYRELRSYGRENTWLCLMGREATDGSFQAFQERVLGSDIDMQQSLDDDSL